MKWCFHSSQLFVTNGTNWKIKSMIAFILKTHFVLYSSTPDWSLCSSNVCSGSAPQSSKVMFSLFLYLKYNVTHYPLWQLYLISTYPVVKTQRLILILNWNDFLFLHILLNPSRSKLCRCKQCSCFDGMYVFLRWMRDLLGLPVVLQLFYFSIMNLEFI